MNAKYLILAGVVTVWAGAAAAAINYGHAEPVVAEDCETAAIPRVVVSAKRIETPIARVVVVGHRTEAPQVVAAR